MELLVEVMVGVMVEVVMGAVGVAVVVVVVGALARVVSADWSALVWSLSDSGVCPHFFLACRVGSAGSGDVHNVLAGSVRPRIRLGCLLGFLTCGVTRTFERSLSSVLLVGSCGVWQDRKSVV